MTAFEMDLRAGMAAADYDISKPVLVVMVGLPRSGKSTWAKAKDVPIVCPDYIRLAMHGRPYLEEAEPWIWAMTRTMIKALFYSGHWVVILDACNANRKRRADWINPDWQIVFNWIRECKETCIDRATKSVRPELVSIIERMDANWQDVEADEGPMLQKFTDL